MTATETKPQEPAPRSSSRFWLPLAVGVLVVLIGAEVGVRLLDDRLPAPTQYDPPRLDHKATQIGEIDGAQVVFVGSSMIDVGVEPSVFIAAQDRYASAYNAATENASPRLWQMWLDDVVLPGLEPDVVVIGVSSFTVNDEGSNREAFIDTYVNSPARTAPTIGADPRTWSALYNHRRDLRSPDTWQQLVTGRSQDGVALHPLGYNPRVRERPYEVPDYYSRRTVGGVLNDYSSGGKEAQALESLVASLQDRGVTPVIVIMPAVLDDHLPMHPNGLADYAQHLAIADDIATVTGVTVLRPPETFFDESLFVDPVHLNGTGADRFSRWLAAQLTGLTTA